jgi:hypothetical protein
MFRYLILFFYLTTLTSVIQAADMVVIHSHAADSHPVGQLLDSQATLTLPAKSEITVVFESGGVKTITGPYQGQLNDPLSDSNATSDPKSDPKLVATLADFLRDQQLQTTVRSTSSPPEDLWWIDVNTNKRHYCLDPSTPVTLWRTDRQNQSASTLVIKRKATGQTAQDTWPAQQATLQWPNSLPVVYGDTYTVELQTRQGGTNFKKVILYRLPDNLPTESHKVVWMVGRGCIPQANMLLARLH